MLKPIASLAIVLGCVHTAAQAQVSPEVVVVARLYRDFAWEVVLSEPQPKEPTFVDQQKTVLERHLTRKLASLLLADRACASRTRQICNLDFDPIWASQDPAATDLKVRLGKKKGTVEVTFTYPSTGTPIRLVFDVVSSSEGARIADIHYPEAASLQTILSRKLP